MRVAVIINRGGGAVTEGQVEPAHLCRLFAAHGVEATVELVEGSRVAEAARAAVASGIDAVVAGGGDGTISTVAGVVAGREVPLGVLPLGTANHFAKDLGIPLHLEEAVRVVARGSIRVLDVGAVNGHVFVNNSSLGFYPAVVEERNRLRRLQHLSKRLATFVAAFRVYPYFPILHLHFEAEGQQITRTTPFVFIGNNAYEMNAFTFGARLRFSTGKLFVYLSRCTRRRCLLRFALLGLVKDLKQDRYFEAWQVPHVTLHAEEPVMRVFADGELLSLQPPLHYRSLPGALRVLLPSGSAA